MKIIFSLFVTIFSPWCVSSPWLVAHKLFFVLIPKYWKVHKSVKEVTCKQLLTHKSGFRFRGGLTYASLKENIAKGIDTNLINDYQYEGENFAVMRRLIPRLAGNTVPLAVNGGGNFDSASNL